MSNKLFVGNLSFNTTENDLNDAFAAFGTVTETNLMMDRMTNRPRGFGFVTMATPEEAQKAIEGMNGKDMDGRALTVNVAKPREERPPGGGGGGGGRREYGGGGGGGGGGGTFTPKTIAEIRAFYTGSPLQITGFSIEGVVISDKVNGNINSRNIAIQDASGRGIIVRFGTNHNFNLGDKVLVNITNDSLSTFSGILQLGGSAGIISSDATLVSSGNTITPTTVTIAAINNNIDLYESTLVKIVNATFSGGTTYNGTSGTTSLSDGASIAHYTTSAATFKGDALPSGPKTVTAIVGRFNSTKQLSIRNTSDVQ